VIIEEIKDCDHYESIGCSSAEEVDKGSASRDDSALWDSCSWKRHSSSYTDSTTHTSWYTVKSQSSCIAEGRTQTLQALQHDREFVQSTDNSKHNW